jgi:hypothetical protein
MIPEEKVDLPSAGRFRVMYWAHSLGREQGICNQLQDRPFMMFIRRLESPSNIAIVILHLSIQGLKDGSRFVEGGPCSSVVEREERLCVADRGRV